MADDNQNQNQGGNQNQNQGKGNNQNQGKGGGQNQNGINVTTRVDPSMTVSLGQQVQSAVVTGLAGAVSALAVAGFQKMFDIICNKWTKRKIQPIFNVTPVAGRSNREISNDLHNVFNTNPQEAAQIIDGIVRRAQKSGTPLSLPSLTQANPTPTPAPAPETPVATAAPVPAPEVIEVQPVAVPEPVKAAPQQKANTNSGNGNSKKK